MLRINEKNQLRKQGRQGHADGRGNTVSLQGQGSWEGFLEVVMPEQNGKSSGKE